MANLSSSKSVVWAAIAADVLIAAAKFAAAALTGGASIAAEGIHSIVDAASGGLMLYGYRQSSKGPDPQHPFGHGREVYFWSFIVSLLLFTLGAGLAVAQGATRILNPSEIRSPLIIFAVLFAELIFAGFSWRIAFKAFRKSKGELGYWEAIKSSKDPPGFIVLAQDTSSIIGVGIAAAGTFAASYLHAPLGDGIASVLIGILLGAVGLTLARESKGLLIGEGARKGLCASILKLAETQSGVEGANGAITAQLGPEQVVVALSLEFADEARSPDIERAVQQLEARVRKQHPEVVALYVKPQTPQTFKRMAPTG